MPFTVKAQERGEISVFGGYVCEPSIFDMKSGWEASLAGNILPHVALVADFSGYRGSSLVSFFSSEVLHESKYNLLFGPRYTHTFWNRLTPFIHVQFGTSKDSRRSSTTYKETTKTSPALATGGGLDARVSNRVSLRMLQVDVIKAENLHINSTSARVSFGAVIRLNKVSNKS